MLFVLKVMKGQGMGLNKLTPGSHMYIIHVYRTGVIIHKNIFINKNNYSFQITAVIFSFSFFTIFLFLCCY